MQDPEKRADEGRLLAGISNRLVSLHREVFGKGPEHIKTYIEEDIVVCVLRGGSTAFEQTLYQGGRNDTARATRTALQETAESRFRAAIEEITGRGVEAFISGSRHDPDIAIEVFVLKPD
jgi:uncharacterized protein YbcI